jgi:hypothetical protein
LLIPPKTALELAEQLNMTVRIYGLFLKKEEDEKKNSL